MKSAAPARQAAADCVREVEGGADTGAIAAGVSCGSGLAAFAGFGSSAFTGRREKIGFGAPSAGAEIEVAAGDHVTASICWSNEICAGRTGSESKRSSKPTLLIVIKQLGSLSAWGAVVKRARGTA